MCFESTGLDTVSEMLRSGNLIPIIAIVFGCTVGIVGITASAVREIFVSRAREATKRELAAYVAEGSLTADAAIALAAAGTGEADA